MLCAAESPARSVIASVQLAMERASSEPLGPASTVRYRFLSSSRMRGAGSPPPCEGESPPNFANCPLSSKDSGGERAWRPAPSNSLHACYTQVSLHALYCLYTLVTRKCHVYTLVTRLLHAICYTLYRFLSSSPMRGAGSPPPCEAEGPPSFAVSPPSFAVSV